MKELKNIIKKSNNRFDFWISIINQRKVTKIAEIGVFKGEYAEKILLSCSEVSKYLMIDPWQHLDNWNKPANVGNDTFEEFYNEALNRTDFADNIREILRGRTKDVHDRIKNDSLDFVYIDGDHTLRGISVDLITIWDKIAPNGFIGGDDFCSSIWQHDSNFEPTLVFPFVVYFAEAKDAVVYALPFNQFLIEKGSKGFKFIDLTKGEYEDLGLLHQLKLKKNQNKKSFLSKLF